MCTLVVVVLTGEQLCYKPAGVYRKTAAIQVWYYNNELEPSSLGCKESACSDGELSLVLTVRISI